MLAGPLGVAQVTRHPHPLVDPRRRGRRSDRTRLLDVVRAVRNRASPEVMAPVLAGKAFALGGAADVDQFPWGEDLDRERLAHLGQAGAAHPDFPEVALRLDAGLLELAGRGPVHL